MALHPVTEVEPTRQNLFCALADIEAAKVYLRAQGTAAYQIENEPIWPYHTSLLTQHEALLREPLEGMRPRPTTKPCYLATLGRLVPAGTELPWQYWLRPRGSPSINTLSFRRPWPMATL